MLGRPENYGIIPDNPGYTWVEYQTAEEASAASNFAFLEFHLEEPCVAQPVRGDVPPAWRSASFVAPTTYRARHQTILVDLEPGTCKVYEKAVRALVTRFDDSHVLADNQSSKGIQITFSTMERASAFARKHAVSATTAYIALGSSRATVRGLFVPSATPPSSVDTQPVTALNDPSFWCPSRRRYSDPNRAWPEHISSDHWGDFRTLICESADDLLQLADTEGAVVAAPIGVLPDLVGGLVRVGKWLQLVPSSKKHLAFKLPRPPVAEGPWTVLYVEPCPKRNGAGVPRRLVGELGEMARECLRDAMLLLTLAPALPALGPLARTQP
jgi:hypothetical protein